MPCIIVIFSSSKGLVALAPPKLSLCTSWSVKPCRQASLSWPLLQSGRNIHTVQWCSWPAVDIGRTNSFNRVQRCAGLG